VVSDPVIKVVDSSVTERLPPHAIPTFTPEGARYHSIALEEIQPPPPIWVERFSAPTGKAYLRKNLCGALNWGLPRPMSIKALAPTIPGYCGGLVAKCNCNLFILLDQRTAPVPVSEQAGGAEPSLIRRKGVEFTDRQQKPPFAFLPSPGYGPTDHSWKSRRARVFRFWNTVLTLPAENVSLAE